MYNQSEGVLRTRYLAPVRVCLLVAVGCSGCWLVVAIVVVSGVTPRIFQADILAKVLSSQKLHKKSNFWKGWGATQHIFFAHNFDARLAGRVIWADRQYFGEKIPGDPKIA